MSKNNPPSREIQELELRAIRHERALRQVLEAEGGIRGAAMQYLVQLFGNWRHRPCPECLPEALAHIERLSLMSLPEHRYGVAGALAAAAVKCPDEVEHLRGRHARLLATVDNVAPHLPQGAVSKPEEVEYLWMFWMVTGIPAVLARVAKLATQPDAVGVHAAGYLLAHAHLPEVVESLAQLDAMQRQSGASKGTEADRTRSVRDLVSAIVAIPGGRQRAVQVGWSDGKYVVWTRDGQPWSALPATWGTDPIVVRKSNASQLAAHQRMLDASDEV